MLRMLDSNGRRASRHLRSVSSGTGHIMRACSCGRSLFAAVLALLVHLVTGEELVLDVVRWLDEVCTSSIANCGSHAIHLQRSNEYSVE